MFISLKLDLKADAISPINVAQRFGNLPAACEQYLRSTALTEQARPHVMALVLVLVLVLDLWPTSGTIQANDANSG